MIMVGDNVYSDYEIYDDKKSSKSSSNKKILIIGIIVVILVVGIFSVIKIVSYRNSYAYLEKQMIELAKEYVSYNNLVINKETYIEINKLDIKNKAECSEFSGVIVDQNNHYQAYLSCANYETEIKSYNSDISLIGSSIALLPKGISFVDSGYQSNKDVSVVSSLGEEAGVYNIFYNVIENGNITSTLVRKVIVIDNSSLTLMYPTISLNGLDMEYVINGKEYKELGVKAYDSIDGDISNKKVINGRVDTSINGVYTIVYTITNSRGYSNTIKRQVIVISDINDISVNSIISPEGFTSGNVTIMLSIIGEDYAYTVLPDNSYNYDSNFQYIAKENGNYDFVIYNKYGNSTTKTIYIDNIKRITPTATCQAVIKNKSVEIAVSNESTAISQYKYIIDDYMSSYQSGSTYIYNVNSIKSVSAQIKDIYGNIGEVSCQIEDKSYLYRQIYVNEYGKNCIEGYTCYIQGKFDSSKYCFYSSTTCGTIAKRGCSIVSITTALSYFDIRDKDGNLYTPYTLFTDVYRQKYKSSNVCSEQCGITAMLKAAKKLGLSVTEWVRLNKDSDQQVRDYLKNGPVVIHTNTGAYTSGSGHFMALLAVNEEGLVYLYNPGGTDTSTYSSKYKDDSWVTIDELISGGVDYFAGIAELGIYQYNFENS